MKERYFFCYNYYIVSDELPSTGMLYLQQNTMKGFVTGQQNTRGIGTLWMLDQRETSLVSFVFISSRPAERN